MIKLLNIFKPKKEVSVKIKYFKNNSCRLEKISKGDWIDIPSPNEYYFDEGNTVFVKFGIAMELPSGYEAHILPRSSTFKHYGLILTNGMGIIDNSYSGDTDEWCAMFYATRKGYIGKGDRLVQFRIVENQQAIEFNEVEHLGNESRGGYGSTGK